MKYMMLIADSEDGMATLDRRGAGHLRPHRGVVERAHRRRPDHRGPRAPAVVHRDDRAHRPRWRRRTVTDGPFVEGKEMVGGYGILDVPDLDAALALASSWPGAATTLEIRPIVERDATS